MEKARRQILQAAADQLFRLPCSMLGVVVRLQTGGAGRGYYYSHYSEAGDKGGSKSGGNGSGRTERQRTPAGLGAQGVVTKEG
jgi:hypothetical protein